MLFKGTLFSNRLVFASKATGAVWLSVVMSFLECHNRYLHATEEISPGHLENWVRTVIPRNPTNPQARPPFRQDEIRAGTVIPRETLSENESFHDLVSKLTHTMANATGLRIHFEPGSNLRNAVLFVGEGYVQYGKLTQKFFEENRLPGKVADELRQSSGWLTCHTFAALSEPETIGLSISVMDDKLTLAEKRRCAHLISINMFGFLVAREHEPQIEAFYPRYVILSSAVTRCAPLEYDELVQCVTREIRDFK